MPLFSGQLQVMLRERAFRFPLAHTLSRNDGFHAFRFEHRNSRWGLQKIDKGLAGFRFIAELLGPLPPELQSYVSYSAGFGSAATVSDQDREAEKLPYSRAVGRFAATLFASRSVAVAPIFFIRRWSPASWKGSWQTGHTSLSTLSK